MHTHLGRGTKDELGSSSPDRETRIDFTGRLLELFVHDDMDPFDVEDVHPDIRAAMRRVDIELQEPERYKDDPDA